jgi:hypothetical protein
MTHTDVLGRLSEYLVGDLPLRLRALVDAHRDACDSCRTALGELRGTVALLRSLPDDDPPPRIADAVMARIHAGEVHPGFGARLAAWLEALTAPKVLRPIAVGVGALALFAAVAGRLPVGTSRPPASASPPARITLRLTPPHSLAQPALKPPIGMSTFDEIDPLARPYPGPAPVPRGFGPVAGMRAIDPRAAGGERIDPIRYVLRPDELVRTAESLQAADRERWLELLAEDADQQRVTAHILQRLRSLDDPRARPLADHFERVSAPATDR